MQGVRREEKRTEKAASAQEQIDVGAVDFDLICIKFKS